MKSALKLGCGNPSCTWVAENRSAIRGVPCIGANQVLASELFKPCGEKTEGFGNAMQLEDVGKRSKGGYALV